ncbi:MAG: hypothetical protein ACP5VP_06020 [Candidatus Limnocylindrales bacterium]
MSIISAFEIALAAALGLLAARARRSLSDLVVAAALVVGLIGLPVLRGVSWHWGPSLVDICAWILVIYFVAELLTTSARTARHVPVLRRIADWQFDRELYQQLERFYSITASYPADGSDEAKLAWGDRCVRELRSITATIRHLDAPSEEWTDLAEDYAAAFEAQARHVLGDVPDPQADAAALDKQMGELADRLHRLRAQYERRDR